VTLAQRRVDHHGPLRDICSIEQSRREQVALIAEPNDYPWPQRRRNDVQRVPELFVGYRCRLPRLKRLPLRHVIARVQSESTLRDIDILSGSATCRPSSRGIREPSAARAEDVGNAEARAVVAVYGQAVANSVGDRARVVDDFRAQQAANNVKPRRLIRRHTARQSEYRGEIGGVFDSQQHPPALYERSEVVDPVQPETRTNVVGLIDTD